MTGSPSPEDPADTRRFVVVGNPVAHSRSPQIHAAFGRQTGVALIYDRLLATPESFAASVHAFAQEGGIGMNVTVPFKELAFNLADVLTPRAQAAGAVNTLHFVAGAVHGDNTDGAGLVNDLLGRFAVPLQGARVMLIGAGGAARGAMQPLLAAGIAHLSIANRTLARAQVLVDRALTWPGVEPHRIEAIALAALADAGCQPDIIIHATPAGLSGSVPDLPDALFAHARLAYDMGYADAPTPFMQRALQTGCTRVVDGLGMLVEQAAESFALWHGVRPITDPVFEALRKPPARKPSG